MPRRRPALLGAAAAAAAALALPAAAELPPPAASATYAGVAVVDATGPVGASAGQYDGEGGSLQATLAGDPVDPYHHDLLKTGSYGVQSRLSMRALVLEGPSRQRVALVKSDNYLAQDLLVRRVGQLLAGGESRVTADSIVHSASHNHSSPYQATLSAGVWAFQTNVDLRVFEAQARAMAQAIERAAQRMVPVRMAATTVDGSVYKGNVVGPALADDGSPAGYPDDFGDTRAVLLRVDDLRDPSRPRPMALWLNHGQHPESLDGHNLITGDFLAPLERMVQRETGAVLLFTQGDVGSAEGPYDRPSNRVLPDGTRVAWAHVGHAQTERGARRLADQVVRAAAELGAGRGLVPWATSFPVAALTRWVPGPLSHPVPTVSNCRSTTTAQGDPGAPVVGLPDCERAGGPREPNPVAELFTAHGLPVPGHYGAPGFPAVEENVRLKLQVVRLGEVVLASCACEPQVDLVLNVESRANDRAGDIWDGYDWSPACTRSGDGWACRTPAGERGVAQVSDAAYRLMRAQVHNDAKGWDAPESALGASADSSDPAAVLGNFTKEELPPHLGYRLPVVLGHTGDYNGYTVSFREYASRDHYRKALTAYGPHTADWMATRLVRMAAQLKGGPAYEGEPHDDAAVADELRQEALARAVGAASGPAYDAWEAALPDDVDEPDVLEQPRDVRRFSAALLRWRGGTSAVDNPVVVVDRLVRGRWVRFADMSGEVQTMVDFPAGLEAAQAWTGSYEWRWTAGFETGVFGPDPRLGATPTGTYRFVVTGQRRADGETVPYRVVSRAFNVVPWGGLRVESVRPTERGVVVTVPPQQYPRTYAGSPFPFVKDDQRKTICRTCSFRPWAVGGGDAASVLVEVVRKGGRVERVAARRTAPGVWLAAVRLRPGDVARVPAGGVVDRRGEVNRLAVSG